jgi:hypothetical protein
MSPACAATIFAILWEINHKGWIYRDITKFCEPKHRLKYKVLIVYGLKYTLK